MEDRAPDLPSTLHEPAARERKRRLLGKPRVAPLTDFVRSLREKVPGHVPYFDPDDGGIFARDGNLTPPEGHAGPCLQSGF